MQGLVVFQAPVCTQPGSGSGEMGMARGKGEGKARTGTAMESWEGADLTGVARWGDSFMNVFLRMFDYIESAL